MTVIAEYLHSYEVSRIDNSDKVPIVVDNGICPDTVARLYDIHERWKILHGDLEILGDITGRNWIGLSNPSPPRLV